MTKSRNEMILSILGYAQLSIYGNAELEYLNKWSTHLNLDFDLNNLNEQDKKILLYIYFITNPVTQNLINNLKKYRSDISISTRKQRTTFYGQVKGTINWNLTIKERLTTGSLINPLFICNPTKKDYDLPENIILKYLLSKLSEMISFIIKKVSEVKEQKSWITLLKNSSEEINMTLNSPYIKLISNVSKIDTRHLSHLNQNKKIHYKSLLNCYILYNKVFIKKDIESQKTLLLEQALINLNDDKLYEIYILFKLYRLLDTYTINKSFKLLGIAKTNSTVAVYRFKTGILEIRFQTLPKRTQANCKYVSIVNSSRPSDERSQSPRCPDVFLSWKPLSSADTHNIFIELKHSSEKDYFGESVYKAFGYIYDFNITLTDSIKGILVFDSGINPVKTQEFWISDSENFENTILELLKFWNVININTSQETTS